MRLLALVVMVMLLSAGLLLVGGCQQPAPEPPQPAEPVESRLINPTGPLVLPVAGIESGEVKGPVTVKVSYWKTNDEAVGLLTGNQTDFAILPVTLAANLYANQQDLMLVGVHEWKVFYLLARQGVEFTDWTSLKGQTLYMPVGKGQTVDVLSRLGLIKAGLTPEQDVKFVYAPPQEIVSLFKSGKIDFAALPEPFVTLAMQDNAGHIVLDFQEYWGEVAGVEPRVPIAGLFVKKDYAAQNPQVVKDVAQMLADSTEWCLANTDRAIEVAQDTLPLPAPVMKASLERTEFKYIPAAQCRGEVDQYLKTIQEIDPEAIQQIPDQGFYSE
ncbi:MAG: ABC transporter substrate-binding protein [Syntrophomonadaceae bacterium]|nr:ABC transporter substrate-binding protein [Syntrophomonadaceae bacterium]